MVAACDESAGRLAIHRNATAAGLGRCVERNESVPSVIILAALTRQGVWTIELVKAASGDSNPRQV